MKKLTERLEDELFCLHKGCWSLGVLIPNGVARYNIRIEQLYKEGYQTTDHMRFITYLKSHLRFSPPHSDGTSQNNYSRDIEMEEDLDPFRQFK